MYRNKNDRDGSCADMGASSEKQFSKTLGSFGLPNQATGFTDQIRHIDFFVDVKIRVDVKSRKRIHRGGDKQDEYVWIEFVGNSGKKGWLYGEATHIAFERQRDFVVVPRSNLANLCEDIVCDEFVSSPANAHLMRYQRPNKKDQCSLIPMHTITKSLPCLIIKKHL